MAGIYDILAGMGAPAPPYQPRPDRALYGEAASQGRDMYGPLVMDAFEQEDAARFAAMRNAWGAGDALAMGLNSLGPVGAPYGAGAGQIATSAEALGRRAYSEGTSVAGDIAARLQQAGQDPGIGAALQDIARRSQGTINALGAGGVENLLSKEIAATAHGKQMGDLALAGFRSQAEAAGRTPSYANARQIAGQEADAITESFGKAQELEMEQVARSEKEQQDAREFIMNMAFKGLDQGGTSFSDQLALARFNQSVTENAEDQTYRATTLAAREAEAAARASEKQLTATEKKEADRVKARKAAMGTRDETFSTIETAAASTAARLAKGYKIRKAKLDVEGGETGEFETITKQYAWAEAMKRAMQELAAKYKTELSRSGIKSTRLREIIEQALVAAQFAPPNRPNRPTIT